MSITCSKLSAFVPALHAGLVGSCESSFIGTLVLFVPTKFGNFEGIWEIQVLFVSVGFGTAGPTDEGMSSWPPICRLWVALVVDWGCFHGHITHGGQDSCSQCSLSQISLLWPHQSSHSRHTLDVAVQTFSAVKGSLSGWKLVENQEHGIGKACGPLLHPQEALLGK